jgi:hypothetical protein
MKAPMAQYLPDKWAIIKITEDGTLYKVLAAWGGGYLGADSWRMSSGIKEVKERSGEWEVTNHSGSIYGCRKHSEGFTYLSGSIYEKLVKDNSGKVDQILMKKLIKELNG